jgi:trans-aconitate methyltransferase
LSQSDDYQQGQQRQGIDGIMAAVTIVYWRDIPAQVIVGQGRRAAKVQLTERFEQAIDRCAMKVGARDTDSYLAEWRKAVVNDLDGDPDAIAKAEAARLEAEFDTARLKSLIDAEGWAKA